MNTYTDPTTQAQERLREMVPQGCKVYGIIRHVARSGMSRVIDFYTIQDNRPCWITGLMEQAYPEDFKRNRHDNRHEGIRVSGAGMDMVFATVYTLAHRLYGDGYALTDSSL